jgi:hypothetical protein
LEKVEYGPLVVEGKEVDTSNSVITLSDFEVSRVANARVRSDIFLINYLTCLRVGFERVSNSPRLIDRPTLHVNRKDKEGNQSQFDWSGVPFTRGSHHFPSHTTPPPDKEGSFSSLSSLETNVLVTNPAAQAIPAPEQQSRACHQIILSCCFISMKYNSIKFS